MGKKRSKLRLCQDKRDGTEDGIRVGVRGAVFRDGDGVGKQNGDGLFS
jgi:hypothetical protein